MSGSEGPLYALATVGNLVDLGADQSLDDAPDERPGIAAPEEIAGEPGRDAVRSSAAQRRQPPPPGLAREEVEGRQLGGFRVENRPVSARPRATRPAPGHAYCARWGAPPPFRTLPTGGWRGQRPRATRNTGPETT